MKLSDTEWLLADLFLLVREVDTLCQDLDQSPKEYHRELVLQLNKLYDTIESTKGFLELKKAGMVS